MRCDDLRATRCVAGAAPGKNPRLEPGQALLKVDKFAFTANNVTYAAFGAAMDYWKFFPSADAAWGRIPVWGFGDVLASNCSGRRRG